MTRPTLEPHIHTGISAVTVMLEDYRGKLLSRDSLGRYIGLRVGELYWLAAARSAVNEPLPSSEGRIHALQISMNMPACPSSHDTGLNPLLDEPGSDFPRRASRIQRRMDVA